MGEGFPWSKLYEYRNKIHQRYPEIWNLKILRKRFPLIIEILREGEKVLDIGASNRDLEVRLQHRYPNLIYKNMDVDREGSVP